MIKANKHPKRKPARAVFLERFVILAMRTGMKREEAYQWAVGVKTTGGEVLVGEEMLRIK